MSKTKKRRVSYENYKDRKQHNSKRAWLLVAVLLIITSAVLAVGIQRSNEQKARLLEEVEQYFSQDEQEK